MPTKLYLPDCDNTRHLLRKYWLYYYLSKCRTSLHFSSFEEVKLTFFIQPRCFSRRTRTWRWRVAMTGLTCGASLGPHSCIWMTVTTPRAFCATWWSGPTSFSAIWRSLAVPVWVYIISLFSFSIFPPVFRFFSSVSELIFWFVAREAKQKGKGRCLTSLLWFRGVLDSYCSPWG